MQQRTRSSTRTSEKALRLVCEKLRLHQVTTIIPASALDAPLRDLDRNARTLLASLARHAHRALLNPETEKVKDVWDLVAFGRPGGGLPFTDISQGWLREAAKRRAVEELPRRRGRGVGGSLRSCVHSLARLSETLRLREDSGQIPGALGRADIEALLNRLAYQQNAGTLTHPSRVITCRHLKLVLSRIRPMGLTRPGGPAAGLPDDFTVSTSDIPYLPGHAEPSRDLPPEIMRQLCDQLPLLERQHGVSIRTIVELVIDTGRRPDEICTLAWDCLTRDSDGSPVLIYDNHKAGRMGRRLPVTEATATLITGQKQRTRGRYPATPPDELRLFPALQRNPGGRKPVAGPGLVGRHRAWVDSLPPLLLADRALGEDRHDGHHGCELSAARQASVAYDLWMRVSWASAKARAARPARYWPLLCALERLVAITTASGTTPPWRRPSSEDVGEEVLLMELILSRGRLGCRRPKGWIQAPPRGSAREFNRNLVQSRVVDASERWARSSYSTDCEGLSGTGRPSASSRCFSWCRSQPPGVRSELS